MDSLLTTLQEVDKTEIAMSFNCDIENLSKYIHINKTDLTIITQNIRSIYKNLDDLQITLSSLKYDIDFLILTECRLDSKKPLPKINNYSSFSTTRHVNQNDGVTIFYKNNLKPKIKEVILQEASCLQIEIFNYAILGIYRSPSNVNPEKFTVSLHEHLDSLKTFKNIIITGDININLIPKINETNFEYNNRMHYINMLSVLGLLPGHILPT